MFYISFLLSRCFQCFLYMYVCANLYICPIYTSTTYLCACTMLSISHNRYPSWRWTFICVDLLDAPQAALEPVQTNLPYLSVQALGNNLLVDVKDDYCTCPDNGLEILKCSYVTRESARDRRRLTVIVTHRPPEDPHLHPTNQLPAVSCHCRAGSFTQQGIMTF